LSEANFNAALQASCSIPFVLQAIHDIPGAPPGAYWDGGITDYHLHLDYASRRAAMAGRGHGAVPPFPESRGARLAGQGLCAGATAPRRLPGQHGGAGA
jgi:hypothetical protein